jgi:hypothetical protein
LLFIKIPAETNGQMDRETYGPRDKWTERQIDKNKKDSKDKQTERQIKELQGNERQVEKLSGIYVQR